MELTYADIYADIDLINPREPGLRPVKARALFDSGAMTLCIPEHVALQLSLAELEKREVTVNPVSPNIPTAVVKLDPVLDARESRRTGPLIFLAVKQP